MSSQISLLFRKYHTIFLVVFWLVHSTWLFYSHGPQTMFDSHQYLGHAQGLWDGQWVGFWYSWYISYIGFLALVGKLFANVVLWGVIFQVLLSGVAAIYVYRSAWYISKSALSSFLATFLFILWYKIQVWNFFILTESVFISLLVFLFFSILKNKINWVIALSAIVLFVRPTGIIVLIATLFALILNIPSWSVKLKILVVVVVGAGGLLFINRVLDDYGLVEEYSSGKIVHSADRVKDEKLKKGLYIKYDEPLVKTEFTGQPVRDSFRFFVNNPVFTAKLTGTRALYFILDYRPYHSTMHTFINVLLLLACYVSTVIFILNSPQHRSATSWFLFFLAGSILMAGFAFITWEGRFFAPIYPFLFIFASCGVVRVLKRDLEKNMVSKI